jgi:tetratricopeptide (TPR) repeat protein
MAPSVYWGNLETFISNFSRFGPESWTPYPLYGFLVHIIGQIPGISAAFLSNLMSSFFAAASVMIFYLIVKRLSNVPVYQKDIRNLPGYKKLVEKNPDLVQDNKSSIDIELITRPALTEIPSLAAAALFAVTLPVWLSAVRADVYSFQLALTMLAIMFVMEGVMRDNRRLFFLGVWFYALTFTNHAQMALMLAPAFLYLIMRQIAVKGYKLATLTTVILLLAASATIYFYLPIHATLEATYYQGASSSLNTPILEEIGIAGDKAALISSLTPNDLVLKLKSLGLFLAGQIGWPIIVLMILAFWGIYKGTRRLFVFFPLAILGSLIVVIWFGQFDPRNYSMINYLAPLTALLILIVAVGMLYLLRMKLQAAPSSIYVTIFLALMIYAAAGDNYVRADISTLSGPEEAGKKIIKDLPQTSMLIVADENLIQPLWYHAYIEAETPNSTILSPETIINQKCRPEIRNRFPSLKLPAYVDSGTITDPARLISDICRFNAEGYDIYLQYGVPGIGAGDVLPSGVLFRYAPDSRPPKSIGHIYGLHMKLAEEMIDGNQSDIRSIDIAGRWLYHVGKYYEQTGGRDIAWKLYDRALIIDTTSTEMRVLLAESLAREGEYKKALKIIADALDINSDDPAVMDLGYRIVKELESKVGEEVAAKN